MGRYSLPDRDQAYRLSPFAPGDAARTFNDTTSPNIPVGSASDAVGISDSLSVLIQADGSPNLILSDPSLGQPDVILPPSIESWGFDNDGNVVGTTGLSDFHSFLYNSKLGSAIDNLEYRFPGETFSRFRGIAKVRGRSICVGQFTRQPLGNQPQLQNGFASVRLANVSQGSLAMGSGWFPYLPISFAAHYLGRIPYGYLPLVPLQTASTTRVT